ncbi:chemotaxis protein CheC [Thermanaerothrix sp.]|jgi:chemotaxis protein CheC|uniref:chemotaxis protein CheC n=1 Tax=Thermanaerothrix sp. TaxID=2972675 RepID=UPI002ADE1548|nr:chemotaxis protein CheC [Thermanaerothrix sp.]
MAESQLNIPFDEQLLNAMRRIADEGVAHAARGFSDMVGGALTMSRPQALLVPVSRLPEIFGSPEDEAVGIYLRTEGSLACQIMLVVPLSKALELVDMVMGLPAGTTQALDRLERSALAEVGNLTASFFINRVAELTGQEARPTPPAVIVDMLGAIVDIVVATTGGFGEHLLVIRAGFTCGQRTVNADFWVVPDPATLRVFHWQGPSLPL